MAFRGVRAFGMQPIEKSEEIYSCRGREERGTGEESCVRMRVQSANMDARTEVDSALLLPPLRRSFLQWCAPGAAPMRDPDAPGGCADALFVGAGAPKEEEAREREIERERKIKKKGMAAKKSLHCQQQTTHMHRGGVLVDGVVAERAESPRVVPFLFERERETSGGGVFDEE